MLLLKDFIWTPVRRRPSELPDLRYTAHNAQMMYELLSGQYYVLAIYHPVFDHKSKENIPAVMIASNIEKIEIP